MKENGMFLPTLYCSKTNQRHIVKNKQSCICGAVHNPFFTISRKQMRSIKFKPLKDINCKECKEGLRCLYKN